MVWVIKVFCLTSKTGLISPNAIKVHVFRPSGRKVYTVIGKAKEYWTTPDLDFCSCRSFYFGSLSSGNPCYHLIAVRNMIRQKSLSPFDFLDYDYDRFIMAIINDSSRNVLTP
jgi:predicted nucleic acid-binding Zn finger protein